MTTPPTSDDLTKLHERIRALNDMLAVITADAQQAHETLASVLRRPIDAAYLLHIQQAKELIDYSSVTPVGGGAP